MNIIEKYEDARYPIPEPSHAALLRHLLGPKNTGLTKLAKTTGLTVGDIKAILNGKRQIRPQEAEAFGHHFSVAPTVFEPEPGQPI